MTRLLIGFILGTLLSPLWTATAQKAFDPSQDPLMAKAPSINDAPAQPSLTLAHCVDVVADFEIVHGKAPAFQQTTYGITLFDWRIMYIFEDSDLTTRRVTTIHELLHVRYHALGIAQPDEKLIHDHTNRIYRELFGQAY